MSSEAKRSHVEFVVMTHDTLQVYTNYSSKLYRDIKKSFSEIVYYQLQPGIIILTYNRKIHEVSMIHGQINKKKGTHKVLDSPIWQPSSMSWMPMHHAI